MNHRRFVNLARLAFLLRYAVGSVFCVAIALFPRMPTSNRCIAAVGAACCLHQFAWGWRVIRWPNYRYRWIVERDE